MWWLIYSKYNKRYRNACDSASFIILIVSLKTTFCRISYNKRCGFEDDNGHIQVELLKGH